jgi:hypothetical protein
MIQLPKSLNAWATPAFNATLKQELEQLDACQLPLQQGLSRSSYATDSPHTVVVLGATEEAGFVRAKVGIFYGGIIAGCSCADDPTPVEEENEYCELRVEIDKATGGAVVMLVNEPPC